LQSSHQITQAAEAEAESIHAKGTADADVLRAKGMAEVSLPFSPSNLIPFKNSKTRKKKQNTIQFNKG